MASESARELLEDGAYWSLSHVGETRSVELVWKASTESMSEDDFKQALSALASYLGERQATGVLVDVRAFGFRMTEEVHDWRLERIIPAYNQAGLRRFAYLLAAGSQLRPGGGGAGARFETEYFDEIGAARAWLAAALAD
jgi:hypothetical protein